MAIIKTFQGKSPQWGERCYLADNATLIGDCTLGNDCSIWFGAVIRADINSITLGDRTNLQDCACIHVAHGEGRCTIGNDATALDGAVVGNGAIVAAGAVVLQGTQIPPYEIWGGIPARRLKAAAKGQAEAYAQSYMEVKEIYRQEP